MNYREADRMNNKEIWLHAYECAVENLMDIDSIGRDQAIREVDNILENESDYLDDYFADLAECYK